MFFLPFFPIFFAFFERVGGNFKKELFLFLCYAYASLLSDCCYSSTASGTKARKAVERSREESNARQGKACRRTLSLSRIGPSCVDSFYSLLFWGRQRKHKQELGEELRASCVCAGRELVRLSCLFS